MSARILVLGAAGRLGHAAAQAFRDGGWTVASLVRLGGARRAPAGTEIVELDALDHVAVAKAGRGADVVLHALNPPIRSGRDLRCRSPILRSEPAVPHCSFPPISTISDRRCHL
jgi:nucleoside-diphosphate-sugar epimerase